jgi:ABC-type Fe3+ transport system permease subunit
MKKLATLDLLAWLACLVIAVIIRRFAVEGSAPASLAVLLHSIVPGTILGVTWVTLRVIVREWLPPPRFHLLRASLTIVVLPCAYLLFYLFVRIEKLSVSRIVIMAPVIFVGLLWAVASELKKANNEIQPTK